MGDNNKGRLSFFVVGDASLVTAHPETILKGGISLNLAILYKAQQRGVPEEIIELEPIPQVATTTSSEARAAAAAAAAGAASLAQKEAAAAASVLASEAVSTLNDSNARAGRRSADDRLAHEPGATFGHA